MREIVVIGGPAVGKTLALQQAIRAAGVVVLLASRHVPQVVEAVELGAALLRDARLPPDLPPQPYPVANLPKRSSWQVPGLARTGKRQREQRTKRGR